MIVLGIETCTRASSVALGLHGSIEGRTSDGAGHAEFLMPAITALCEEAGITLRSVEGIAVSIGPGLFTGMRVGIATAKTIAQLLGAPLLGIPSLDLLAYPLRDGAGLICSCLDAKRSEVFAALYRGMARIGDHASWDPDALAGDLAARGEGVRLVGNGAEAYRAIFERVEGIVFAAPAAPSASVLVELATPRLEQGERVPVANLEPLYLRKTDAEIRWEQRGVVIERPFRVRVPKRAQGGAR